MSMFHISRIAAHRPLQLLPSVVSRFLSTSKRDFPRWLQAIEEDVTPPPKLFAWSPDNLPPHLSRPQASSSHGPVNADAERRIYILGMGNIGILFATSLSRLSDRPPITLVVHRKELLESWQSEPGLQVTRNGHPERLADFDIEWWTDNEPCLGPKKQVADGSVIRNLLVSTKSSAAFAEVDKLRGYLDSSSTVVFAQNGMCKLWQPYGEDYLSIRYPHGNHPHWLGCVTTHGVTSHGRFCSEHVSMADFKIGPVHSGRYASSYLSETLCKAPFLNGQEVTRKDLWVLQLEKLIVNSIINPLTAVLGCKNGKLFQTSNGPISQVVEALLHEASEVLRVLIQHPIAETIVVKPEDRRELMTRFSTHQLRQMLLGIGHRVSDNTSSMLQDYRAGKPTEIQDLNGWLVDMATFLGVKSLIVNHQALVRMVEMGLRVDEASLLSHLERSKISANF